MNLNDVLTRLESLGNEKTRTRYKKIGAGDNIFGVKLGDIRRIAAEIKSDHQLAVDLWNTRNVDARLLAILLFKPQDLSREALDLLVRSGNFSQVADWLSAYVVKNHPEKEALRKTWMQDPDPWAARAGWGLTSERINRDPEGLDIPAILARIETEMATAAPQVQWTMNFCLAGIGINFPELRDRAISIGEKLGIYRDYPVSKGCTSPFAPIWINEMVKRQSK